jgi:hypothetical protein
MAKSKTKMISVRVSEADYLLLKDRYESHGTRSVSALAREALHNVLRLPDDAKPVDLPAEVEILQEKLLALQLEVSRLSRAVADRRIAATADGLNRKSPSLVHPNWYNPCEGNSR